MSHNPEVSRNRDANRPSERCTDGDLAAIFFDNDRPAGHALDDANHLAFDDPQGNRYTVTVEEAIYNRSLPDETFIYAPAGK